MRQVGRVDLSAPLGDCWSRCPNCIEGLQFWLRRPPIGPFLPNGSRARCCDLFSVGIPRRLRPLDNLPRYRRHTIQLVEPPIKAIPASTLAANKHFEFTLGGPRSLCSTGGGSLARLEHVLKFGDFADSQGEPPRKTTERHSGFSALGKQTSKVL